MRGSVDSLPRTSQLEGITMSVEMGVLLANCVLSLAAIIKTLVSQNSSKQFSDDLVARVKVLEEKLRKLDGIDEKFLLVNTSLTEVKTQLNMLLSLNGIKLNTIVGVKQT